MWKDNGKPLKVFNQGHGLIRLVFYNHFGDSEKADWMRTGQWRNSEAPAVKEVSSLCVGKHNTVNV